MKHFGEAVGLVHNIGITAKRFLPSPTRLLSSPRDASARPDPPAGDLTGRPHPFAHVSSALVDGLQNSDYLL